MLFVFAKSYIYIYTARFILLPNLSY
jgi:hypothetical protein